MQQKKKVPGEKRKSFAADVVGYGKAKMAHTGKFLRTRAAARSIKAQLEDTACRIHARCTATEAEAAATRLVQAAATSDTSSTDMVHGGNMSSTVGEAVLQADQAHAHAYARAHINVV